MINCLVIKFSAVVCQVFKMKKFHFIYILILLTLPMVELWAKESSDCVYVKSFDNTITVSPFTAQQRLELHLESTENEEKQTIDYRPNIKNNAGIAVNYKNIGAAVAWNNGITALDSKIYGKSKYVDIQLNFYLRRFEIDLSYQRYKKFYLDQPEKFDPQRELSDPYPQRKDLQIDKYFFNVIYVFNPEKFSLKAAVNQTEKQMRSGGSWLLLSAASFVDIRSDSTLIPVAYKQYFSEIQDFSGGELISAALAPGYGYSMIYNDFYITPCLFLGPGIGYNRYDIQVGDKSSVNFGLKGNLRLGCGYSGECFFTGFYWVIDGITSKEKKVSIGTTTHYFKILLGYRFQIDKSSLFEP